MYLYPISIHAGGKPLWRAQQYSYIKIKKEG